MSTVSESRSKDLPDNRALAAVMRLLYAVRASFLAFVFVVGVVWLLIGIALGDGVMAGMFGIWGVSAMLYAVLGKFALQLIGYA
jgi:hypothetical protein